MAKVEPLRFTVADGREFTLEFNRRTVQMAEKNGLTLEDIDKRIMSAIPELFYYSFKMHHAWIKRDETDRILFDEFKGLTEEEMKRLCELYAQPYEALLNSSTEGDEKNLRTVKILN